MTRAGPISTRRVGSLLLLRADSGDRCLLGLPGRSDEDASHPSVGWCVEKREDRTGYPWRPELSGNLVNCSCGDGISSNEVGSIGSVNFRWLMTACMSILLAWCSCWWIGLPSRSAEGWLTSLSAQVTSKSLLGESENTVEMRPLGRQGFNCPVSTRGALDLKGCFRD